MEEFGIHPFMQNKASEYAVLLTYASVKQAFASKKKECLTKSEKDLKEKWNELAKCDECHKID
jgi:hypothetical protein